MGRMDPNEPEDLPANVAERLGALEAGLPELVRANPDPTEFWETFLQIADPLEEQAGGHQDQVQQRIAAMLAVHGRYLVGHPVAED